VIASLMVESKREAWHLIVQQSEDAGADGLELNFGCPHGMSERGMGSAVGQVPDYAEMITSWVKEKARTPVLVKLTPNITDIRTVARAAKNAAVPMAFPRSTPSTQSRELISTRLFRGRMWMGNPRMAAIAVPRSSQLRSTWFSRCRATRNRTCP